MRTKWTNWSSWGLAGVLAAAVAGKAHAASFAIEQRWLGPAVTLIRVYEHQTGRTIWTRRTNHPRLVRWSADRSAVAVLDDRAGKSVDAWFDLLVWRNGERVRTIRSLPPFRRFELVRDLIWSPDERRLLLLGPYSQGEADLGFNRLWSLALPRERTQLLADGAVTRAQWIAATRVRYWTGRIVPHPTQNNEGVLAEAPHERDCR